VTRFYSIDDASAALPEVERILLALRDQRTELIRLRDRIAAASTAGGGGTEGGGRVDSPAEVAEVGRIRLAMQGLIDQMQAGVARIDELDVVLRDIGTGLIDFPALVNGRQIWLCWRLGDGEVAWWHELTTGVAGRQLIVDLA